MDNINFVDIFFRILGTFVGSCIVWFFIFRQVSKVQRHQEVFEKSWRNDYIETGREIGKLSKIVQKNSLDIERINNPVTIAIGEIHQRMNGIDDRINNLDKK